MELGISSLGHLVELASQNKSKSLEDLLFQSTKSCLIYAEKNDIDNVEIVIEPQDIICDKFKEMFIDMVNSFSIKKQIHGPFININLCSHNFSISQASIEAYIDTYRICKELKSSLMTIHPGVASFIPGTLRTINLDHLAKSIKILIESLNDSTFMISMENMPRSSNIMLDTNNIEEIYEKINNPCLFMTYDTSHFYTNNGKVDKLWKTFHLIIKNVHLVENFSKFSDTHPNLGTGKVKFKEIIEIMKYYNYKGPLIIELGSSKGLNQSIDYINNLL